MHPISATHPLAENLPRARRNFLLAARRWLSFSPLFFSAALNLAASDESRMPAADQYDPVADPHAVVIAGPVRFTVLTPQMIRMEWSADGKFEDHASLTFLNRRLPVPAFTQEVKPESGRVLITTGALRLEYKPAKPGDKFSDENLSIAFSQGGSPVIWKPGLEDTGNLLGTTRTLDRIKGSNVKLESGLISRNGWAVVDDSLRPLFNSTDFSFSQGEKSPWPWLMQRPSGKRLDWYFLGYGHNYKQALFDYTQVAGKISLPPRFAFGVWWSRYWAYSDKELIELVGEFQNHNVPLDVLVIDMDWHKTKVLPAGTARDAAGQRPGWTGYSWNRSLFPNPGGFLRWVHKQGLKVTLNLHPASGVQRHEDAYPEMARAMGLNPVTQQFIPFNITDQKFAINYFDVILHPLEQMGVDFWWLDWQQGTSGGMDPTWWLNYTHFTDQEREGKRPLIFHRWGGLGNHRYQIGFSGDTTSDWPSLAFQPYFTATAANVGYAYWSHDIGGHLPGVVGPELYTRWIQFGAFSPVLRTHTTKNPEAERRIWAYPAPYADIMHQAFVLREALIPYIYTEARRTYDTGVAFLRPLYYDSPEAEEAYHVPGEYNFGDNIIVAPVTHPVDEKTGLAEESIWLPKGEWVEWPTSARLTGPGTFVRKFTLSQTPVYIKAGSIIPMQPTMRSSNEKPLDPLILNLFPLAEGQSSSYRVYEDAGNDVSGYKHGECAWTEVRDHRDADMLTVDIAAVQGSYPGMPDGRGYELRLPDSASPQSVVINGLTLRAGLGMAGMSWNYDKATRALVITLPFTPKTKEIHVEVKAAADSPAKPN